ncbi:hypothetical protein F5X96DRAFT_221952 [Biscogniauxia mediterranea]|nr:hypothetical protein F5X96DRAFT_221952 [Biscogniauxia mediterranea]
MAAADTAIYYRLSADDFETASIRSAAPSYISEAPSYHSTIPPNESTPAYTPATVPHYSTINRSAPTVTTTTNTSSSSTTTTTNNNNNTTSTSTTATSPPPHQPRSLLPPLPPSSSTPSMISTFTPGAGLPRLPSPRRATAASPSLSQFRMPTSWSSSSHRGHNNPQARHYHSVASRRAAAAAAAANSNNGGGGPAMEDTLRSVLARANMSSSSVLAGEDMGRGRAAAARMRPLEDPYLVGEEAAARARRERLARENGAGDEVLVNENRRWDWFLAQMKDYEERDRGWTSFGNANGNRRKLARRFGR